MPLWEDWGVLDSHRAPGPGELPGLDELATLTGQPSPPLQPRPDRCAGGRRRQRSGPGSQLTGALARLAARPGGIRAKLVATRGPRISAASLFGEKLPCLGLPGPTTYSQGT
jgi:hypothetical protein